MSGASIVNKRRHHPSMDRSDATLPTPTNLDAINNAAELAANLIRRKAQSDADRVRLLNVLGIDDVTSSGLAFTPEMQPGSLAALDAQYALGVKP